MTHAAFLVCSTDFRPLTPTRTAHNSHSFYAIKSLNAYSCTLTKFVSFVIRAHLDLLGGQPVRLSSEQRAACASLVTALQSHDDRSESEDHLQSLMWLLVSAKRGQYALDMHYTPFFHYSIYSSLQRNGQFHRASVIGHNNAQLMFAARAAVFYHVHLIGKSTDGDFLGYAFHAAEPSNLAHLRTQHFPTLSASGIELHRLPVFLPCGRCGQDTGDPGEGRVASDCAIC